MNTGDSNDTILEEGKSYEWCLAYTNKETAEDHGSTKATFKMDFKKGITGESIISDTGMTKAA